MKISKISAFARPDEHLTRQTLHGAVVTILGCLLASTLFCHEVSWFLSAKASTKMEVDLRRHHDLNINVDITFHTVPCAALSVDIIDASGTAESDVNNARGARLHKVRLDAGGARVGRAGSEYKTPQSQRMTSEGGASVVNVDLGSAVQHMNDMEAEIGAHEGCRLSGDVTVRRVAGRLHFAVHQQSFVDLLPQMLTGHVLPRLRNMSHTINRVTFGPSFPGQVNPLDGTERIEAADSGGHAFKYYIKIVPTEYTTRLGAQLETGSYSVSEYAVPLLAPGAAGHGKHDPFVDLVYDLSPIIMHVRQSPLDLLHFLVRLCAVVGGALSVTRLFDGLVHGAVLVAGLSEEGGGRHSSASGRLLSALSGGGLLPTCSSSSGGGGSPRGASVKDAVASLGASLLRRSSAGGALAGLSGGGSYASALSRSSAGGGDGSYGGAGSYGGSLAGGASGGGGGGRAAVQMSSLGGHAPPVLAGFGSWTDVNHGKKDMDI
ncbi:MAG: endoplasmic reticulum vesicle transporter-domain-containing protein [Monoraphidium minutum]|nr:MAG: endoplasmic reticulum vesicle transporter-domain-containing protein [Monoraphidium minutum]